MSNGVTISTASANLYLTSTSNPLTITSTGSVTSTGSSDAISAPVPARPGESTTPARGFPASSARRPPAFIRRPQASPCENTGQISGHVAGLSLTDGGTIVNGATGQISATGSYGVYVSGARRDRHQSGNDLRRELRRRPDLQQRLQSRRGCARARRSPGSRFRRQWRFGAVWLRRGGNASAERSAEPRGSFENFGQLVVDAGAVWALSGALQITTVQLAGSLEVASDTTSSSQIAFASGGKLIVDDAASFSGPVLSNFVAGDTIDIHNFSAAGAAISYNSATGVATITNSASQTATLDLSASTLGAGQLLAAGTTGIDVTLGSSTAPAAPTITNPASGSTDTTTAEPTISGTGVAGDTVTLSIDGGASVTTTVLSNGSWSYTPASPLSNASHTITATQAATGGPSSAAATDTFTVNVATAPAAPTITSPASGSTDTTTAEPTISGTGVAGDTVTLSIDGGAS